MTNEKTAAVAWLLNVNDWSLNCLRGNIHIVWLDIQTYIFVKGAFFHMKCLLINFLLKNYRIIEKKNHQVQIHQGLVFKEIITQTVPPKEFSYCQHL